MPLHSSITRIPFTPDAYAKMQAEFKKLLVEQDDLIVRVNVARAQGDLSENGAYKYGKIELGNVRHRLRELRHLLKHAQVIHSTPKSGVISFGNKVLLKSKDKSLEFMLVSEYESNPAEGKLSDSSPIGSAVKGKKIGDEVTVTTPGGEIKYTVISVL